MKQKIVTMITIGSIFCMMLTGCGGASGNRTTADATTTYVAEFPDGSQANLTKEEAEKIKEFQEELGILEESLYKETEEEKTVKEPFDIDTILGREVKKGGYVSSLGAKYKIYENGAAIFDIENEYAVIQEEVEYEGVTYPVNTILNFNAVAASKKEFEIPSHIKYIGKGDFSASIYSSPESLIIPETVEYISGHSTFEGLDNLKSVTFLGEVETESKWGSTFSGCVNLQTVIIPEGVTDLSYETFYRCDSLVSVSLPNGLKTIGEEAFRVCKSLEEIEIPESVEIIGDYAFYGCYNLKEVKIPDSVISIGEFAFSETSIKHIDIPENVESLNLYAFSSCSELEEFIIPDTVISYRDSRNNFTSLKEMNNLRILKFSNNCDDYSKVTIKAPKLELVIFPDSTEEIREDFFKYVEDKSNLTIQVPEKTVEYFQKKFPEINVVAKE